MTTTRAHFLDLELDHRMISRMHIFGFARFTQIIVIARLAFETNASNRGLLTPIASDATVDDLSIDRLSELQKRMLCRVNAGSLAGCAEVVIWADRARVASPNNRKHIAAIASDVAVSVGVLA
jgi:hypothetical protein